MTAKTILSCVIMACEITKEKTCVLLPREYIKLREHLSPTYQAICDVLLHSGMRIEEFWRFAKNPEWYKPSRRCIALPKQAILKTETVYKSRDVILSIKGCEAVEHFLRTGPKQVCRQSMNDALDRAAVASGLGAEYICPKMFRKTIISWLVAVYPERNVWINASAGHTADIQLRNYIGTAFRNEDKEDMRQLLRGWGEA